MYGYIWPKRDGFQHPGIAAQNLDREEWQLSNSSFSRDAVYTVFLISSVVLLLEELSVGICVLGRIRCIQLALCRRIFMHFAISMA